MLILHIGIAFIDMTLPDRENRRRAAHCVSAFRRHVSGWKRRKSSGLPSASFQIFRNAALSAAASPLYEYSQPGI